MMKPASLLMTFPFQVLQEVCVRPLHREHRPTEFKPRIKQREKGKEPCSRPREPPAHPQVMYVVSCGLYGNFSWVWVLREGGLYTETVFPFWHFRVIKGTVTATQTTELGTGMFQQKVLFAEHTESQAQAVVHPELSP